METSDHGRVASRFGEVVGAVRDWDSPTPVPEWITRDIVHHLTTWFPEFLASGGITIPVGRRDDPIGSWHIQSAAVSELLAMRGTESFTHPYVGTRSVADTIGTFYAPDVFMHTWDLARASGFDDRLDDETCAELLAGMASMGDAIRASGQFGVRQPVSTDADAQTQLLAFIGRDPGWRPPS